ncbi:UNVERIFIED_CONTAM: hypothetical protein Sangu_1741100, partial [Sesamum angustifolium]
MTRYLSMGRETSLSMLAGTAVSQTQLAWFDAMCRPVGSGFVIHVGILLVLTLSII